MTEQTQEPHPSPLLQGEGGTKEKKPLKIGRIEVDRDLCIGAASCVAIAPDSFELDNEAKAVVKNLEGIDPETILNAAKSCPTNAIFVYDEDGKQIYP